MRELRAALLPDDENGQVLRQMLEDGDDLSIAREIEFFHVFGAQEAAQAFADAAAALPQTQAGAHEVDAPEVDDEGIWEVCVRRHMEPTHAGITALESQLAQLADGFGGYADGWGCNPANVPLH